jgi:hypothetical protein
VDELEVVLGEASGAQVLMLPLAVAPAALGRGKATHAPPVASHSLGIKASTPY